jgi:ABC-2 type transport system permease protein
MKRLFYIEWLKIIHYRTAWIFIVLYFLLLILMGLIIPQISPTINGIKLDFEKFGAYNFPVVWQNITYFAAIGKIFLVVILITNVTNEYSNGTLKQNLIDGLSKKEFLVSKLISAGILTVMSTIVVFGITLFLGITKSTVSPESLFSGIEYMGVYALKLFYIFCFALFLSLLFKKSAFALLMYVVWSILENILFGIEVYLRSKVFKQSDESITLWTDFLPLKSSAGLIELPKVHTELLLQNKPVFEIKDLNYTSIALSILYTCVLIYGSYQLLAKRDL